MSVQDEINRINQNIANTYSAMGDMGATLPQEQNSANMASTVRTIPQSGGGGDNPLLAVNAVGTLSVNQETGIITLNGISDVDQSVPDIMAAALSGKQVTLQVDVTEAAKPIFGVPPEFEVSLILYFNLTILTSISDVAFSAIVDFTNSGVPVVTRICGRLSGIWECSSAIVTSVTPAMLL